MPAAAAWSRPSRAFDSTPAVNDGTVPHRKIAIHRENLTPGGSARNLASARQWLKLTVN
jgi:hypothetical protein